MIEIDNRQNPNFPGVDFYVGVMRDTDRTTEVYVSRDPDYEGTVALRSLGYRVYEYRVTMTDLYPGTMDEWKEEVARIALDAHGRQTDGTT